MYRLKLFASLLSLVTLIYLLNSRISSVPPLGKFLDPFNGFWQQAEGSKTALSDPERLPGLLEEVVVEFDDQMVPHIFAQNNYDLYFTQGFITAQNRLWQMDFQTRLASGRLSEVVGERAVELDKYYRRIGMVWGAEHKTEYIRKDSLSWLIIKAYTDGVNAYIDQLDPKQYPLEFKILDYQPEAWTPLKTTLTLMLMAYDLTAHTNDFYLSNIAEAYGKEVVDELFPDYPYYAEPIVPVGTEYAFKPINVKSDPSLKVIAQGLSHQFSPDRDNGSNNWAIGGSKSTTGFPILANDPHLQLNLPSIWYQAHLNAPGINVTGVTLPGTPNVIIGFNDDIAWGITNVGADVLDWYQVSFKDSNRSEYLYNGQWFKSVARIETIQVLGGKPILDTVLYTRHGPVVYHSGQKPFNKAVPPGYAIKWVAHEKSDDSKAFVLLNRATGYDDYVEALSKFSLPSSNVVYADKHNNIALWVNGRYPLKWKGQGKFVMDGADPQQEWQGYIPHSQVPKVKNPGRGFVSSANQVPADTTYPYYLGWNFASFERGRRINERLTLMSQVTADSMRSLQNDNMNLGARLLLPTLLQSIKYDSLTPYQKELLKGLESWNLLHDQSSKTATLYDVWWSILNKSIWNQRFGNEGMMFPPKDVTMHLIINKPESHWFDDTSTVDYETADVHIHKSFIAAVDSLDKRWGSVDQWAWGSHKGTSIQHIARIPGLGIDKIVMGGGRNIVNATSERHGPSWRMVVEAGPDMRGMGIYPGGQSGNPGSYYYDNQVDDWKNGKLFPLFFTSGPGQGDRSRIKQTIKLQPQTKE
jgi:penicillin G amidase